MSRSRLVWERYEDQHRRWPTEGRHILAQYDETSVVVYQAYRASIGNYAVEHQQFGGEWSFDRMSWIKPNFLWMMYRCDWARSAGQEVVLAIRLDRRGFEQILAEAIHSSFVPEVYPSHAEWQQRMRRSRVRLQWDPDHDPFGHKCARRAIQLGLRGETLRRFGTKWIVSIEDISEAVREQHAHVRSHQLDRLETPSERVFPVEDPAIVSHLGLAEA